MIPRHTRCCSRACWLPATDSKSCLSDTSVSLLLTHFAVRIGQAFNSSNGYLIHSCVAGLNACSSLETLILSHCDVNDNRLPTLVSVLCNPNSKLKLKQLNLSGNTFTSASAEWIQYLLEHNKTLEGISFSENEALKEDFGTCTSLT
jgi:hypothetical protein